MRKHLRKYGHYAFLALPFLGLYLMDCTPSEDGPPDTGGGDGGLDGGLDDGGFGDGGLDSGFGDGGLDSGFGDGGLDGGFGDGGLDSGFGDGGCGDGGDSSCGGPTYLAVYFRDMTPDDDGTEHPGGDIDAVGVCPSASSPDGDCSWAITGGGQSAVINRRTGAVGAPDGTCDDYISLSGTYAYAGLAPGGFIESGLTVRVILVDEATCAGSGSADDLVEVLKSTEFTLAVAESIGTCDFSVTGNVCNILVP